MKNSNSKPSISPSRKQLNKIATYHYLSASTHPQQFRHRVRLSNNTNQPLSQILLPWQSQDFNALDPAWLSLAGKTSLTPPFRRAYLERPRGHSKTTDTAIQLSWILQYSQQPLKGICTAADLDQALLIHQAISKLVQSNQILLPHLVLQKQTILNPNNNCKLSFLSSDIQSSWGLLPDFIICDEIAHWTKSEYWFSLLSSAAKSPHCLIIVLSNAGIGTDWQWQLRESARTSKQWHFSTLDGPQAPWIKSTWLEEQQKLLPPSVYNRLWNNQWQHSEGTFLSLKEAEACRNTSLSSAKKGHSQHQYIAAIDYAEKHDYTVATIIHQHQSQIIVDRMDVTAPTPESPTPVSWVSDWLESVATQFPNLTIVIDPWQLIGLIQQYESQFHIKRFEFLSGKANHKLALTLRQLILEQRLSWYEHCGQLQQDSHRDDLETELASVFLKQSPSGSVRIDHKTSANHHDDRVFALGAACLTLLEQQHQTQPSLTITPPLSDNSFPWFS